MTPDDARLRGPLPSINDMVAVGIIALTYLLRIGTLGPDIGRPTALIVTADLILPSMAGAWLFAIAMLAAISRLEECE